VIETPSEPRQLAPEEGFSRPCDEGDSAPGPTVLTAPPYKSFCKPRRSCLLTVRLFTRSLNLLPRQSLFLSLFPFLLRDRDESWRIDVPESGGYPGVCCGPDWQNRTVDYQTIVPLAEGGAPARGPVVSYGGSAATGTTEGSGAVFKVFPTWARCARVGPQNFDPASFRRLTKGRFLPIFDSPETALRLGLRTI